MNIVGYATGWGIGSGCNTLRSHVDKKLPTVEFSLDLSTVKSDGEKKTGKTFAALYMGSEGLEGTKGQLLGCVEVDWWKSGGVWNGQEVVVGDLFRVDEGGCVSSTFQFNRECKNSGPCKNAWQAVEKKSGQKWDDVWTKDLNKAKRDGKKYARLWTNNATWKLEQK